MWGTGPGGGLSARLSNRSARLQWLVAALVARLFLPSQPETELVLLCRPGPLAAWRTLVVVWHTLVAKSGMAKSLARLGVDALQRPVPAYTGVPIAPPACGHPTALAAGSGWRTPCAALPDLAALLVLLLFPVSSPQAPSLFLLYLSKMYLETYLSFPCAPLLERC